MSRAHVRGGSSGSRIHKFSHSHNTQEAIPQALAPRYEQLRLMMYHTFVFSED